MLEEMDSTPEADRGQGVPDATEVWV